jgi:hypothetical protein
VSWIDGVDYGFDGARAEAFYQAIRTYYPALRDGTLDPVTPHPPQARPARRTCQ